MGKLELILSEKNICDETLDCKLNNYLHTCLLTFTKQLLLYKPVLPTTRPNMVAVQKRDYAETIQISDLVRIISLGTIRRNLYQDRL